MNKKILVAALCLCAIVAPSAFAQQPDNSNAPNMECSARKVGKRGADASNPFEGLNLTADQQTKLKALKEECKARAEQRKEAKKERKEVVCKARAEHLAKIKEILTPEQYIKFLENSYLNAGKFDKKMGKFDRKGLRPAHRPQTQN